MPYTLSELITQQNSPVAAVSNRIWNHFLSTKSKKEAFRICSEHPYRCAVTDSKGFTVFDNNQKPQALICNLSDLKSFLERFPGRFNLEDMKKVYNVEERVSLEENDILVSFIKNIILESSKSRAIFQKWLEEKASEVIASLSNNFYDTYETIHNNPIELINNIEGGWKEYKIDLPSWIDEDKARSSLISYIKRYYGLD